MTITPKQRKLLWLGIGILVVAYYTPSVVNMAMQSAYQRQAAQRVPPTIVQPLAVPPAVAPFHYLVGQYSGRAALATRGLCALKFELRDNHEKPGAFSGYSTLTCTPIIRRWRPAASLMLGSQPTSAILAGVAESGAIRFHVDDTVAGGCAPTALSVKPFGSNQLAIQFQDPCGGGTMLLDRTGR